MTEDIIRVEGGVLPATLELPSTARGVIVFAHGSGSSRLSRRNVRVAAGLRADGLFGTLLFDLLTGDEDAIYENRFDIGLLTERLIAACRYLSEGVGKGLPLGVFGASTGAAAALKAATTIPDLIVSVVSRGGRPDLAGDALARVVSPTLLIVGGADTQVLALNRRALTMLPASTPSELAVVEGATHLFGEPGALEEVTRLTREWFGKTLGGGV